MNNLPLSSLCTCGAWKMYCRIMVSQAGKYLSSTLYNSIPCAILSYCCSKDAEWDPHYRRA